MDSRFRPNERRGFGITSRERGRVSKGVESLREQISADPLAVVGGEDDEKLSDRDI